MEKIAKWIIYEKWKYIWDTVCAAVKGHFFQDPKVPVRVCFSTLVSISPCKGMKFQSFFLLSLFKGKKFQFFAFFSPCKGMKLLKYHIFCPCKGVFFTLFSPEKIFSPIFGRTYPSFSDRLPPGLFLHGVKVFYNIDIR